MRAKSGADTDHILALLLAPCGDFLLGSVLESSWCVSKRHETVCNAPLGAKSPPQTGFILVVESLQETVAPRPSGLRQVFV